MAGKVNKIINVKVEGVGKIKQLEESLKKLRKQQRDIKKDMKDGANAGKHAEQQYKKNENAIKGQSKALRETKKAMLDANNTTKKSTSLQNSMAMGVLKGAAAFSILVTAFRRVNQALTTIIGTFTEFEFTMAKVRAVSGATGDEFKKLSDSAQELGRSTFFTASEVANLQLNLSKLGFTTDEILAATEATINLSIATGSDLARSATVAGNAVRGFQLDATETGRVVDVMAVAFTSSALDIEKWQTSMTKVAPIATMAGFSIEETTAIMAKLSDTGIEASIAGTSLRNIFLKMQDPTSELTRKVGHTIHSLDGMLKVFKDMQAEGTDLADVLTFMDVRQVAAFGTMLQGADDMKALVEELENADGAGQRMADTVGDTLEGSILKVKSAFQGLSISIVQNFGGALKKTLVQFARWLNKLAKNPEILQDIGNKIKFVIKTLAFYVIGAKTAALATKLASSSFFTMATAAQRGATMVRMLGVSLKGLGVAIASTGIGLLVVGLGQLAANFLLARGEAEKMVETTSSLAEQASLLVDEGLASYHTQVLRTDESLRQLKKAKEDLIKLRKEEADLAQKNTKAAYDYTDALGREKQALRDVNKLQKDNNKELVTAAESYGEVAKKVQETLKVIQDSALQQLYIENVSKLSQKVVEMQLILKRGIMEKSGEDEYGGTVWDDADFSEGNTQFAELYNRYLGAKGNWTPTRERNYSAPSVTQGYAELDMGKMLYDIVQESEYGVQDFADVLHSQYIENMQSDVADVIKGITGKLPSYITDDDDLDGGKEEQPYKATLSEMTTELLKDIDRSVSAIDLKVAELEAKKTAVEKFLKQKGVKGSEAEAPAKLQQQKILTALDTAYYQKELDRIIKAKEEQINILKNDADFRALTKAEQNEILGDIDEVYHEYQKEKLIEHGQDIAAIESKIAQDKLANEALDLEAKDDKLFKQYETDKLNLDLAYANNEITEIQHKEFMLHLEAMYLNRKAALYVGHGEQLAIIGNQIKENDIKTTEQLIDSMNSYIGKIGELGGHMTDLAGEEEKLAGLRKAGIIITKVAAAAESILAISTTIKALATKKSNIQDAITVSMTPALIASDTAKTASTVALAGATFLQAIADGIKGMPWWAQLLGIVAIVAMIKKVKSSISSAFQTPDAGGGSSDSGGGGSSSGGGGGMMSLMTFGGRHQTVGEIDSYADGGMVHGKSHAQGGEKFAVGGRVVELEGGEAVINKRSTAMFRSQLSAMNTAGGGARFADGGIANVPSFSQTQFQVDGQRGLQGAIGQKSKVVVVESDITKSQNTVTTIQSEASF